ncbi:MAG TPA: hypothetical protein VLD67_20285, partial [Vicinamibacterales bacterium]|nr:hypothetical protein [Vicinamibacterales bacterium]
DFDDPAVLTSRVGSGRLVWWASSGPLSNAGIQKPGHLDLLASVLGPRTDRVILWDEHYHGYTRSLWSYAAGTPVIWGLAQAGLAGALALFTFARRHGPIRHRVTEPRTSPLEFIETMGGLYERAQPSEAAAATARLRVRRMLQSRTGLTASSSDDEVASAVAAKFGMDAKTVKALLARSAAAGRSGASTGDALEVVAGLQRLAAEVAASGHHAGPGGRQSAESAAADRSDR